MFVPGRSYYYEQLDHHADVSDGDAKLPLVVSGDSGELCVQYGVIHYVFCQFCFIGGYSFSVFFFDVNLFSFFRQW